MQYIKNPNLITIKSDYPGNKMFGNKFLNYQKVPVPKFKDIWQWRFNQADAKKNKQEKPYKLDKINFTEMQDKSQDKLVWFGHASFFITLNGKNILIDPVFDNVLFVKRLVGIPCKIKELNNIDYILISHSHFDHLDKKTLKKLCKQNPQVIIYCGLNHENLFRKFGINNQVVEAGWYQQYPINLNDKIQFYFLPALHWSKRTLRDNNQRLWGSFGIKTDGCSLYFMGDSGYSPHFAEIGQTLNGFDYCLLGIGAYSPRKIMQSSHLDPNEAVKAFHDLQGKNLVPMHYATYDLADEPLGEPIQIMHELNAKKQINGTLLAPKVGEIVYLCSN